VSKRPPIHGLMAEFDEPHQIVEAARRAREAGYRKMDAYTPFPVEELIETLHIRDWRLPLLVLVGGIVGGIAGFSLEVWASTIAYPLNVGGRPMLSWPSFIPPAFETTILFAAVGAVLGMIALNGLPMPYHPVFNVPRFRLASQNHFFLCIEATDPKFDREETAGFLAGLNHREVAEVEQ